MRREWREEIEVEKGRGGEREGREPLLLWILDTPLVL